MHMLSNFSSYNLTVVNYTNQPLSITQPKVSSIKPNIMTISSSILLYNKTNGHFYGQFSDVMSEERAVTSKRLIRERLHSFGWYAKLVTMFIIMVCTVVSNIFICWIISAKKPLRTIPNTFILNLALTNLLSSLINTPFFFIAIYYGMWPLGDTWCQVNGMTTSFFGLTSIMTLAGISLNRYCMILYPARYVTTFTTQSTRLMILGIWISAFLFALPPTIGWSKYLYVPGKAICTLIWNTDISYTFFCHTLGIYIPSGVIFYCYMKIFLTVRQSGKRIISHNAQNNVPQNSKENVDVKGSVINSNINSPKVFTMNQLLICMARRLNLNRSKITNFNTQSTNLSDNAQKHTNDSITTLAKHKPPSAGSKSYVSSNTTTSKSQTSTTSGANKSKTNKENVKRQCKDKNTNGEIINLIKTSGLKNMRSSFKSSISNNDYTKNESVCKVKDLTRSSSSSVPSNSIHSTPGSSASNSSSTNSSSFILPRRATMANLKERKRREMCHETNFKDTLWVNLTFWKRFDLGTKFFLNSSSVKVFDESHSHNKGEIIKPPCRLRWPWSSKDSNLIPYIQAKHKSKISLNCGNGCALMTPRVPKKSDVANLNNDLGESPYLLKNQISLSQYRSSWNGSPVMRDYGIAKKIKKFKDPPLNPLLESDIAIAISIPSNVAVPEPLNRTKPEDQNNCLLKDTLVKVATQRLSENSTSNYFRTAPSYRHEINKLSYSCDNILTRSEFNDINTTTGLTEGPSTTSSSYELYAMFRHTYNAFNPSAAFKRIHSCSKLPDATSDIYIQHMSPQVAETLLKPSILNPFQLIPFAAHYGIPHQRPTQGQRMYKTIKTNVSRHKYCKEKLTTMRRKLSKKLFKGRRREDRVITQTILLIVVAFGFCWFPISMVNFLDTFFSYRVPNWLDISTVYLIFLNCALNPIIYGLMNKNFTTVLRDIFSCFYPKSKHPHLIPGTVKPARKRSSRAGTIERKGCGHRQEHASKIGKEKESTVENHNNDAILDNGGIKSGIDTDKNLSTSEDKSMFPSGSANVTNDCDKILKSNGIILDTGGPSLKSCFKSQLIDLSCQGNKVDSQNNIKVSTPNNVNFILHNHIHVY